MIPRKPSLLETCLVFLLAGGKGTRLHELTKYDCKPAVPFAGSARIVDFALANAVNSSLSRIMVATQYQPATLTNHLRSRWRPLIGARGGSLECLSGHNANFGAGYLGTADAVTQNIDRIDAMAPRHVLILAADHIYQMDYSAMLEAHARSGADVTIAADVVPRRQASGFGVMQVDGESRITSFVEKPADPAAMPGASDKSLASMGIYVFDWPLLRDLLLADRADDLSSHDFGKDLLPRLIARGNALAHVLKAPKAERGAYWRDVGTLDAYLEAHMDLLSPHGARLISSDWPLHVAETGREDMAPLSRDPSLLAASARIEACEIRQSVVGPLATVARNASLRRSIVLPGSVIGEGVRLSNVIVAPGTRIEAGLVAGENAEEDARWFRRSDSGTLLIDQHMLNGRAEALQVRRTRFTGQVHGTLAPATQEAGLGLAN